MKDDLQSLIESTVREEIIADAKARRYTKRAETATLATHSTTLAAKIEAKIGDKISALKNELASLRTARLQLKPKKNGEGAMVMTTPSAMAKHQHMARRPNRGGGLEDAGGDDEEDSSLVGSEDRGGGGKPGVNWFSKNELSGTLQASPVGPQHIGHIGEGGLEDSEEKLSPSQSPGRMDAMSQELLRSIEHILKKHFAASEASAGPNPAELSMMQSIVSQLTDFQDGEVGGAGYAQQQSSYYSPGRRQFPPESSNFDSPTHEHGVRPKPILKIDSSNQQQLPVPRSSSPISGMVRKFSVGLNDLFGQQQQNRLVQPVPPADNGEKSHRQHQSALPKQQYFNGKPTNQIAHAVDFDTTPVADSELNLSLATAGNGSLTSLGSSKPPKPSKLASSRALRAESAAANPQIDAELKNLEAEYRGLMTSLLNLVDLKVRSCLFVTKAFCYLYACVDQHKKRTEKLERSIREGKRSTCR